MKKAFWIIGILVIIAVAVCAVHGRGTPAPVTDTTGTSMPHIDSVTPASARIGDTVTIRGTHFSGFEGDKYAWIENAQGAKGIIYGDISKATDSSITFTLESKYCNNDISYKGGDCPSYLNIVPGAYKIYVYPWGNMSNKVDFTVIK